MNKNEFPLKNLRYTAISRSDLECDKRLQPYAPQSRVESAYVICHLKNSKASCSWDGSPEDANLDLPFPMFPSLPIAWPVICFISCPRPPKISVTAPLSALVSDMTRLPACATGVGRDRGEDCRGWGSGEGGMSVSWRGCEKGRGSGGGEAAPAARTSRGSHR